MSFNHELGIKVSLHQAFAGELDTCRDALQDLSDMQEYRRLKDNIEEYIDKKSGEGVIPHNPLEFYLEQLINAEKFLKNLTSETERLHSLQREQVKGFEKLASKGASLKKDRAPFHKIETTLEEVSSELERISSIQEKYRNEISRIVWKETDGQFRLCRELATLSIIKKKHLFDFEASGDVATLIKELRATYPELGLAEAKEIAETGDYSSIVPLIIGVEAGGADDLFDFVFGRGALHDSICEQLHARKESLERLISDHNGQKESISNSLTEIENRNYQKADTILKQLRRIFSDFDYEGLESQIAKVIESVALINGKFASFRSELESLAERDNNSPEQASRDKARCLHIAHEWESWVESKYKNLFSDHPNSEAYKESTHRLENYQNEFRLLIDNVVPSIEVRLLKSEQHSLYKDIEALLTTVMNWPGQVKKTKEEYKSRATKWTALKVQLKNSFADHNKSEFSESAQQSLSNVLAECDAKISSGVEQLNARLTRTRLKLWGGLTCFLMILCAGGFFGHNHLRSLNILEVKVTTARGTPIKVAKIKVNGVDFSSGAIVPTGDLKITVGAEGYDEQALTKTLAIGKPLSLGTIKLERSSGEVLVTSTHDIYWTASFIDESAEEVNTISGQTKKDTDTEAIQFETGKWNISASLTNKPINKIWTENITVDVSRDEPNEGKISFDAGRFTITSETEGAKIFLDKFPIGTNNVSVPNVRPGEYELELKVTDFLTGEIKTKNQKLNVIAGEETKISESFKVASTIMTSSPSGAQVIYEDKMLGKTPITISTFSKGEYFFLLRYPDKFEEAIGKKDRWIEREAAIDMNVGESKSYDENFGLVDLNLDSDPKGARIKIYDSEKDALSSLKGLTPLTLSPIKPGQYRIIMEIEDKLGSLGNKEKRWWSITNNVTVVSEKNAEINSAFVGGKVEIKSVPSGADVMIGNRMLGKTPFELAGLMPEKTDLTVRIKDEFGIKTGTGEWYSKTNHLAVIAGKTTELNEEFKYGSIKFDSVPKGAEVICKGVPLGKAPLIENLVPRNYEFDFKYEMMPPQEDYIVSKSFEIKPSAKSTETVEFQFATINLGTDPDGLAMEWKGQKIKSPFSSNRIKPGEHQFKILSGISSTNYVFSVKGGDVVNREIILNSGIDLTTQPAGAIIKHKDAPIGVSPKQLPNLFPGEYGFVVSMKGYRDVDCRITTLSNKVTRCELPLVPNTPNPFRDKQLRTAYSGYLETPDQSEKYIAESLEWIISKKNKRGYWNTKSGFLSDPRNTAVTALALIGLLNHGYTYDGTETNDVVLTKGVNHILDNAKRTGCLDTDNKMLGHGMATLLIASLDQDKIQGKVKVALQNALTFSAKQQNDDGSWGKEKGVQYESIFILLSYLAAEDAGIEMQAMKKSKTQLEIFVKNNLKIFNKELANLLVLASKKQEDNPNAGNIETTVDRCLKSVSDAGEDGMLADCFILSQISGKLKHKQKIEILRDLTKRFSSLRSDLKSVEKSGYWKTSGKWCPSSDEHMFYSNIVPLIIFQSFYQGGDVSEPVVLKFNK